MQITYTNTAKTICIITPEEGYVLTNYTEDKDIVFYASTTQVRTAAKRIKNWREITLAEDAAYTERMQMADAANAAARGESYEGAEEQA